MYCIMFLQESTEHNIYQIEIVQHKAARFVLHDYCILSHVAPMIN